MTTESTNESPTPECEYANFESTHHTVKQNGVVNDSYFRSEPDVIVRQPITAQPSLTSLYSSGGEPWAYTPSGISPIQRSDFGGSLNNVSNPPCDRHSRTSISTIPKDSVSMSTQSAAASGSRDWSRDLFEPFRDVKKSTSKRSALTKLLCQCIHVPCMTCDVARSLGDPSWLPYVPCTGAALRFKVRILGGIQGTIADDCVVTSCCCPCAVCQMYTEIEDIGLGRS